MAPNYSSVSAIRIELGIATNGGLGRPCPGLCLKSYVFVRGKYRVTLGPVRVGDEPKQPSKLLSKEVH